MSVYRIISGGQIGADIAGLRAGVRMGLEVGGWMPQGFRRLNGNRPEMASIYNMNEHECRGYPPRTRQNVLDSDGTVRFAENFNSPGERCTLRAVQEFNKPVFDVLIRPDRDSVSPMNDLPFRRWLENNDIEILNVAGNALPRIEPLVETFLIRTITRYNDAQNYRDAVIEDDLPEPEDGFSELPF